MKIHSFASAIAILLTSALPTAVLADCEPIIDVAARTWGIDLRVTGASTQLNAGRCAFLITALPIAVAPLAALPPAGTRTEWTFVRALQTDSCRQLSATSAAYNPPAGISCLANLEHADSATLLLHRRDPTAHECYDVAVRPILSSAVHPNRGRQVVCLAPTGPQLIQQSAIATTP